MKKIVLSLSLFVLNVSAASLGWTISAHQKDGVQFVLKTKHSLTSEQADLCADFFSHGLALGLQKGMGADEATQSINQFVRTCEEKIYHVKEEEFLSALCKVSAQTGSSSPVSSTHPVYAIHEIFLKLRIAAKDPSEKELRLNLFGKALPGICCTFFPPYTIVEQEESDSEEELI